MTRHQRRKLAKAKALVKTRREIVRANLSAVGVRERTEQLISTVYANRMDRARGRGTAPITHRVTRIISDAPYKAALGPAAFRSEKRGKKTIRIRLPGCGWRVD